MNNISISDEGEDIRVYGKGTLVIRKKLKSAKGWWDALDRAWVFKDMSLDKVTSIVTKANQEYMEKIQRRKDELKEKRKRDKQKYRKEKDIIGLLTQANNLFKDYCKKNEDAVDMKEIGYFLGHIDCKYFKGRDLTPKWHSINVHYDNSGTKHYALKIIEFLLRNDILCRLKEITD